MVTDPQNIRQSILTTYGLALVDIAHKWRRAIDDEMRPLGLSQATWRTLYFVDRAQTGILQKDLAFDIGIEGPSLVRLLDGLEADGLIERRVPATDRRAKTVHLTTDGRKILTKIQDVADRMRVKMLNGIPEDDLIACLAVFDKIRANAEKISTGAEHEHEEPVA